MGRPRILAAALCATALTTATTAPSADAGKRRQMLRAINSVRGMGHRLRGSHRLTNGATEWARHLMRRDVLAHSGSRGGEIIEWHTGGSANIDGVVREWLNSPAHRRIMLSGRYHRAGAGRAVGWMNGQRSTIWVVRFAR